MTRSTRPLLVLCALLLAAACGGCAAPQTLSQPHEVDRIERVNRAVYRFNRGVDRKVVRPVARFYDRAMPSAAERHVRKFFENLHGPSDMLNNLLQGKFRH